jgi:hypothetical protein
LVGAVETMGEKIAGVEEKIGGVQKDLREHQQFDLTPSFAAKGSAAGGVDAFEKVLNALGCNYPTRTATVFSENGYGTTMGFKWGKEAKGVLDAAYEKTSYGPAIKFLEARGLNAYDISNGQNCTQGELYVTKLIGYEERLGSMTGPKSRRITDIRGRIHGRSDTVITTDKLNVRHLRHNVELIIEVKTKKGMKANLEGSKRETLTQLIGINVKNEKRSPPAILTDFDEIHFVFFVERVASAKYILKEQPCSTFEAALTFAKRRTDADRTESSRMLGFGFQPSPSASLTGQGEDDADDDDGEQSVRDDLLGELAACGFGEIGDEEAEDLGDKE